MPQWSSLHQIRSPQELRSLPSPDTGDRPYKCQYCGDQFARRCAFSCILQHFSLSQQRRSDLLSRHVNKCHANEKPLPSTGARRKGSASASRATTSKQACDQCVQSSLPCDGCNPCCESLVLLSHMTQKSNH